MMGVKELGELVIWLGKVGSAVGQAAEDGKIDLSDLPKLMSVLPGAPSALMGATDIPKEIRDMDAAEAAMLVQMFAESFDLSNDVAEKKVELILGGLAQLYAVVMGLKDIVKP